MTDVLRAAEQAFTIVQPAAISEFSIPRGEVVRHEVVHHKAVHHTAQFYDGSGFLLDHATNTDAG